MEKNLIIQFIENMIAGTGLAKMSEDFKNEYVIKLAGELQIRLGAMAMKELDEKALMEYSKMMDKKVLPEELNKFFQTNIPDFEKKSVEVFKEFAEEFKEGVDKMKGAAG